MLFGTYYLFTTMPTGFIPSQDSGFLFARTLAPQDASFDWVAPHNRAAGEIVRAHPDVASTGVFVIGGNSAFMFARMKPREERTQFGGPDHRSACARRSRPRFRACWRSCRIRRRLRSAGSPAVRAYQLTLQSVNLDEIYSWTPKVAAAMRGIPGLVDVNSDMQISSPQIMVDIDRDRARVARASRRSRCRTRCSAATVRGRCR